MSENVHNCCRLCLDTHSEHISILRDPTIQLHLKSCLGFTWVENDDLPKVICVSCVIQLRDFYNFQLNSRCSQDWLESAVAEKATKQFDKTPIQPLPDSEYNSDSLLEFLNNTENIEDYLNNLGKEDIPSIVSMLDKNTDHSFELTNKTNYSKHGKVTSPKKKEMKRNYKINMEVDVLDSDLEIVQEILMKETNVIKSKGHDKQQTMCMACKVEFETPHLLLQHWSTCDYAYRYCGICNNLFDSKPKMLHHKITIHTAVPCNCSCGKLYTNKDDLIKHFQVCSGLGIGESCQFRCRRCKKVFRDRILLYRHAREHVMKEQMKICDICGHGYVGEAALSAHRKEVHPVPLNVLFRCKVCHKATQDRQELYDHIEKKHVPALEAKRHLCESCGCSFATRATLLRHSFSHAIKMPAVSSASKHVPDISVDRSNGSSMCECCGDMVSNRDVLNHMKNHVS